MNATYYSRPDDSYNTLADEEALPGTIVINGGQVTAIADPTVYAIGAAHTLQVTEAALHWAGQTPLTTSMPPASTPNS